MTSDLNVNLSNDEALVLFDLLARLHESDEFLVKSDAELVVLTHVAAQLEKMLVEPFRADYVALLAAAQARVIDGFRGSDRNVRP